MASTSFCDITLFRVTLVQHAAEIAIAVLGEPNLRLCGGRELQFGNRGSLAVAIDGPKAGQWYDHENGEGGDLIDLIRRRALQLLLRRHHVRRGTYWYCAATAPSVT